MFPNDQLNWCWEQDFPTAPHKYNNNDNLLLPKFHLSPSIIGGFVSVKASVCFSASFPLVCLFIYLFIPLFVCLSGRGLTDIIGN